VGSALTCGGATATAVGGGGGEATAATGTGAGVRATTSGDVIRKCGHVPGIFHRNYNRSTNGNCAMQRERERNCLRENTKDATHLTTPHGKSERIGFLPSNGNAHVSNHRTDKDDGATIRVPLIPTLPLLRKLPISYIFRFTHA
jgi:hypothetical protein